MMSRRTTLGLFASAAAVSVAAAHPHNVLTNEQHGDIERQIMAFRAALKDAVTAKDAVRLKAMYAESFTHTHGSGKVDGRDARIVSLMTGEPTIEMAPASELSFRVHGTDMVVLTGKSPILNVREQRDYDFRWVQVYSRASGEWQLVVSQATRLPTTS
jgi:hypothetical protein